MISSYGCDGTFWQTETWIFNGDENADMTWCIEWIWYEQKQTDCGIAGITKDFVTWYDGGCHFDQNGKPYIHIGACAPGGYGPYGQYIDIYDYGMYELQPWDRNYDDCDQEWGIGKDIVSEVPKIYVVISRRS